MSLLLTFGATASGCAGPATPLGAIWSLHPQDKTTFALGGQVVGEEKVTNPPAPSGPSRGLASLRETLLNLTQDPQPVLQFDPPHQVLHGRRTVQVIIDDPRGIQDGYDFKVRYHGHDVTRSFLLQAKVSRARDGKRLVVEVPSIRLSPRSEHLVEVGYRNPAGRQVVARYPGPVCRAFDKTLIHTTDDFRPDDVLLKMIESISRDTGFNPAFTAALIAQESAFNPRSVSMARALGLTQVTPIAEEEVTNVFQRWPRYPGINEMPAPVLKLMVMSGQVNEQNEWRLSPDRSIRGGLAFAQMLADRWLDSAGYSKISWTGSSADLLGGGDAEVARTRLILASYNSGFARVAAAINRLGPAWLTAPELKEARKYVNRIFSYCDAFGRDPHPKQDQAGGI